MWAPFYHGVARPWVTDAEGAPQIWKVTANILNKPGQRVIPRGF